LTGKMQPVSLNSAVRRPVVEPTLHIIALGFRWVLAVGDKVANHQDVAILAHVMEIHFTLGVSGPGGAVGCLEMT
jgi:hypothetical protein